MCIIFTLRKYSRFIAVFLFVEFAIQLVAPLGAYALTSGPNQPEFSSFEPMATTNMVNEFTGDFTYNLPLLEVPGPNGSSYPLSLSYHSGVNQEEEASWVGFGWTLNPGAINRNTRGFPDDFKGKNVTFHNKTPRNWTLAGGFGIAGELFGKDKGPLVNGSVSIRYNNYRGFGYNIGLGASLDLGKGRVNLGYSLSENGDKHPTFSLQVSPGGILNNPKVQALFQQAIENQIKKRELKKAETRSTKTLKKTTQILLSSSSNIFHSFNDTSFPTTATEYKGASVNFSVGLLGTVPFVPAGVSPNFFGSYTYQKNVDNVTKSSFGYLYSSSAGTDDIMDYQIEKESDYNKRDVFLGIPFNTADNFMVTAEGLGGGFRLYHKNLGHFGPRTVTSNMSITNIGAEVNLGPGLFGGGADVGIGTQQISMKDWKRNISSFLSPSASEDEPVFFRFNNDMGGEWGSVYDDKPIDPKFNGKDPMVTSALLKPNGGVRGGRSSFINYHTNAEMGTYKAYSRNAYVNTLANRSAAGYQDLIGEVGIYNEQGVRYVYALPVYNQQEKQLSYGVQGATAIDIENNYLAYYDNGKTLIGEETNDVYAGSYLLTEVNTPDFVDRTLDGPTQDDFGGYTRFNYKQGITGSWFKWRIPYKGLQYQKNELSDPMDDLGSKNEGQRQVYYVQSMETKTHVAVFYTSDRLDSYEAPANDRLAGNPNKFDTNPTPGTNRVKKLDKISIYAIESLPKDVNGLLVRQSDGTVAEPAGGIKAIKTVYFDYDYTLCAGAPNAATGKLTLKRVYFEYNGVTSTRISPYQFDYKYPQFTQYPSKYQQAATDDVTGVYDDMSAAIQNPAYNTFNIDSWGNYQGNGQTRYNNMETWLDQKIAQSSTFDPAAWQLKVIKLPSGGEIHVQYEQDDYQYVQDQEAHVMAQLATATGAGNGTRFYINLSSIMDPSLVASSQTAVSAMIQKRYVNTGNKIYFKFLYKLMNSGVPDLQTCNAEFIDGYATVSASGIDATNGLYVDILQNATNKIPQQICVDYVKANRIGKLDPSRDCDPNNGLSDGNDAGAMVKNLINMAKTAVVPSLLCQQLSTVNSYLRIPTLLPKKGGGLRVKRLLMFDGGLESNTALYGNEYIYQTKDFKGNIISSGVATNEPASIREENILTDFIARKKQDFLNRIISGDDKKQAEGPIGESVYPGAMVGYSKVTVKNIHSGKTNPGFSVTEFYTAKDYPVVVQMTDIRTQTEHVYNPAFLLVTMTKDKVRAMQGFSFILNEMHGQLKRQASYSGSYADILDLNKSILVTEQQYEYYKPGEKVPVQNALFGQVAMKNPGREVDVTFAQKAVEEKSSDVAIEGDFSMGFLPLLFIVIPIPYLTSIPSLTQFEGEIFSHTSSKVVRYPAVVKKVKVYQDGILHTTENLAFDDMTGRPVAVKSYDEMKGAYLAQDVPAGWEYFSLTNKANSEGKLMQASVASGSSLYINFDYKTSTDASILFAGEQSCKATSEFTVGDLLELDTQQLYYVSNINYASDQIDLVKSVVESSAATLGDGTLAQLRILRSGKQNSTMKNAGSITFHDENASNLSVAKQSVPENSRYTSSGSNQDDGSLFISHLNSAFTTGTSPATLSGTYNHMNMTMYASKFPVGCTADLGDASIRNVVVELQTAGGQVNIRMISFDLLCGPSTWVNVH